LAILDALLAESHADNLAHAAGIYATSLTKRGMRAWFALAMSSRRFQRPWRLVTARRIFMRKSTAFQAFVSPLLTLNPNP